MEGPDYKPPRLGLALLKWIYDESIYDDIAGDLQELYEDRVRRYGWFRACLHYYKDAFLSVRNIDLKTKRVIHSSYTIGMIQNYFKTAIRVLIKHPLSSSISIFGLALAIGCAITTFLYADFMGNLDSFHQNRDRIYQVLSHVTEEGEDVIYGPTPMPLAQRLLEDHPSVENTVRFQYHMGNMRYGQRVFPERILFVDSTFMRVFDFPMLYGGQSALDYKQQLVLSKEMAIKYFGQDNPMGQTMSIKFGDANPLSFVVGGVFDKRPENSSLRVDIVVPIPNFFDLALAQDNDWDDLTKATFVELKENSKVAELSNLLSTYADTQKSGSGELEVDFFELAPLQGLGNRAEKIHQPVSFGNDPGGTRGIALLGMFLLVLASFNYMNIAVASATKRLKEIAIRKVMGGAKRGIMVQFLFENAVLCGLSLSLGTLLAAFLFLPGFNQVAPVNVPFAFSATPVAVLFYLGLFAFITFFSGAYPAFYISRFRPSAILKGGQQLKGKNWFSKGLLTLQFFLVFVMIVGSFVFTDNGFFVKSLGWGYSPENVLAINTSNQKQYDALFNQAMASTNARSIGGANGHIGVDNPSMNFQYLTNEFRTLAYEVSPGYLETMGVQLQEGRLFVNNQETEEARSIIVNEKFVEKMGWEQPLGQQVTLDSIGRRVIGVVSNLRHAFFSSDIVRPMIFSASPSANYQYLVIKSTPEGIAQLDEQLKETFHGIAPDDPYDRIYQSEIFNRYYDNVDANILLMLIVSIFSIVLACLGLYGLMAYNVQKRIREFSIRKVLGANGYQIVKVANREYTWMIIIALLIGVPLGTWLISLALERIFAVAKPIGILPIFLAVAITLCAIVLTVFSQIKRAVNVNPADTLRGD